jgi:hypothetical protein
VLVDRCPLPRRHGRHDETEIVEEGRAVSASAVVKDSASRWVAVKGDRPGPAMQPRVPRSRARAPSARCPRASEQHNEITNEMESTPAIW